MIRDPSDGSVREKPACAVCGSVADLKYSLKRDEYLCDECFGKTAFDDEPAVIETTTSGLPSEAAKDADRHERSRQWLKEYHAKRETKCRS